MRTGVDYDIDIKNMELESMYEHMYFNEELNDLVRQLLNNYNIKANEILGEFKRKKYAISVGDELPQGIIKLAKVYLAKKRKLKVGDIVIHFIAKTDKDMS